MSTFTNEDRKLLIVMDTKLDNIASIVADHETRLRNLTDDVTTARGAVKFFSWLGGVIAAVNGVIAWFTFNRSN